MRVDTATPVERSSDRLRWDDLDEAGQTAARRIDRQIDRLPGLAGLHLVETATSGQAAPGSREAAPVPALALWQAA
jgi:hypothetical protein